MDPPKLSKEDLKKLMEAGAKAADGASQTKEGPR
jgi:hypothetical protein